MTRRPGSRAVPLATFALVGLFAAGAHAQQSNLGGYALDQLEPAPAGDRFFGVPGPSAAGHLELRGYVMFDYAHEPLVLEEEGGAVVSRQGFVHLDASLALFDRLLVSAHFPIAVLQAGDDPVVGGVPLDSPSGAEIGDLRLGARARLVGENRGPFQLGLGGHVFFPTAGDDTFTGDGAFRFAPELAVGGRFGDSVGFAYDVSGGAVLRTSDNPHTITYGAGVALLLADDMVQLGPELYGRTLVGDTEPLSTPQVTVVSPTGTALELLVGAKLRVLDGLTFGVAAGPGLTSAIGVPAFRGVASVGWSPEAEEEKAPDPDPDRDGILGAADACPDVAGTESTTPARNGCPPGDRDGDKIADGVDACPDIKGRANADMTRNGCPADYDKDEIPDAEDACPNQRGVASTDKRRHGCPGDPDGDGDGIADRSDACPKVKGPASSDLARHGCPLPLDGDGDGIADGADACPTERGVASPDKARNGCPALGIDQRVYFRVGRASLADVTEPVPESLAADVKKVLADPGVDKVQVDGHADELGDAAYNSALSQQRAESVRRWLVQRGVPADRLVTKAHGSSQPAASNADDAGRRKNRRVELTVLRK